MKKALKNLGDLLIIITEIALICIGVAPVFSMAKDSVLEFSESNSIGAQLASIINGFLCAGITFAFSFQFANSEIKSIPQQWKIANTLGRVFILMTRLIGLSTTGIVNFYMFEADIPTPIKVPAYIMPGWAGSAILSSLLLNTTLTINKTVKKHSYHDTYHAVQSLNILEDNLQFNDVFKRLISTNDSSVSKSVKQAQGVINNLIAASEQISANRQATDMFKLPNAIDDLNQYIDEQSNKKNEKDIVITNLQRRYRDYGLYFEILKLIITGLAGGYAGFLMYRHLGPEAARHIYGSEFTCYHNDTVCSEKNSTLADIGNVLGYFTFGMQTLIVIFPFLGTINAIWASSKNTFRSKTAIYYLFALIFGLSLTSISVYMGEKNLSDHNNEEGNKEKHLAQLIYLGFIFIFYNFFSIGVSCPLTFKTVIGTFIETIRTLCCCTTRQETEAEESLLCNNDNIITKATKAVPHLRWYFLYRPYKTNQKLREFLITPTTIHRNRKPTVHSYAHD